MHLVYGLCDGNAIAAQRESTDRVCYSDRPQGFRPTSQREWVGPALDTLQRVEIGAIPCN